MDEQISLLNDPNHGAEFSADRLHRYVLWRAWDRRKGAVTFIGLNPSTADERLDDPTIRRCLRFARDWGYGQLLMVNLFSFRATKPRDLWMARDEVGPDNDDHIVGCANAARLIVAAWGASSFPVKLRRAEAVRELLGSRDLYHLGLTMAGHPRHPLYLRADTKPELWGSK